MKSMRKRQKKVHMAGILGLVLAAALLIPSLSLSSRAEASDESLLSVDLTGVNWKYQWEEIGDQGDLNADFSMSSDCVSFVLSQQSLEVQFQQAGISGRQDFASDVLALKGDQLFLKNASLTPGYTVSYKNQKQNEIRNDLHNSESAISSGTNEYLRTLNSFLPLAKDSSFQSYTYYSKSEAGKYSRAYAISSIQSESEKSRVYVLKNNTGFSAARLKKLVEEELTRREPTWTAGSDRWPYVSLSADYLAGRTWVGSQSNTLRIAYWAAVERYMGELGAQLYSTDGVTLEAGDSSVTFLSFSVPNLKFYYYYPDTSSSPRSTYEYFTALLYEERTCSFGQPVGDYTLGKENISASTLSGSVLSLQDASNTSVQASMHPDDRVVLNKLTSTGLPDNVKLQYCWDNSSTENNWNEYTTSLNPWENYGGTSRTLYVRLRIGGGGRAGAVFRLNLKRWTRSSPGQAGTVQISPKTTNVDVTSADKGTEITLSYTPRQPGKEYKILYREDTTDNGELTLTHVAARTMVNTLENSAQSQGLTGRILFMSYDGKSYVKVNDLWYRCSDGVQLYTGPWKLDNSIRQNRQMVIKTMSLEDGLLNGEVTRYRYKYTLGAAVAAPEAVIRPLDTEGNMTEISMGASLSFTCSTSGSQMFYTLNGSSPSVAVDENGQVVPGNANTFAYTGSIVVSESFATYGKTIQITMIAVAYDEDGYKVREDSSAVQFKYKVKDLPSVEKVYSVPAANSGQTQTEVAEGDRIQLFCDTENVKIYYTLDGTEPSYGENGTPAEGTYEYNAGTGVTVPPQTDSLLTLGVVAVLDLGGGQSSSGFSRLVYKYPDGIATPYASPAAGAVAENTAVTLKSQTEDSLIYYTTDGTAPTTASQIYDDQSPIKITQNATIRAIAVKNGRSSAEVSFTYTVSSKLAAPKPSIEGSSVVSKGTIVTLTADSGATIYYTTDGSNPADAANTKVSVGNTVHLDGEAGSSVTIRTYASKTNFSNSAVVSYTYTISNYDGGIFPDRESGSIVRNGDSVHLNTDVSGAVIYYTTDGTNPTTQSSKGSTVVITGDSGSNVIVKAIAVPEGSSQVSAAATFTYQIMGKSKLPQASVPSGAVFTETGSVTLTAEAGNIYYTLDGSTPTSGSTLYKEPISITKGVTLKAISITDDLDQSEVATYVYSFANQVEAPQVSYASGELEIGTKVEFTCATEGASIYYTTNGTEPNTDERSRLTLYTGPVEVNKAVTFKVVAVKDMMQDSRVITVGYTVREPIVQVQEETELPVQESSGRLQSRRSYSDSESGPSYTDVVLRNATYGAVVSAETGVLPEDVQLVVEYTPVSDSNRNIVRQMMGESYGVAVSYDVQLLSEGVAVQPDGYIEIGLPIPVEYENSMVNVVYVAEDGTMETFETRRSGGMAYARTNHLSVYSLAVPMNYTEEKDSVPLDVILYLLAVTLAAAGFWFLLIAKKKKKKEEGGE